MEEIKSIVISTGLLDYISIYGSNDILEIYNKGGKYYKIINRINDKEILVKDTSGTHSVILISNEYHIKDIFVRFNDLPKDTYTQQELKFNQDKLNESI